MKNTVIAIMMICALLMSCAIAETAVVGMANPWTETDAESISQLYGFEFGIPEGAENISYALLEAQDLAEMRFTWDGLEYTARIKPSAEFEDISGLYYDPWDYEEPCQVQWCEGVVKRVQDGDDTVDVCLWFDAVPGIMYSVTTSAPDLDGFDIQAAAEQLFVPVQGDAVGE